MFLKLKNKIRKDTRTKVYKTVAILTLIQASGTFLTLIQASEKFLTLIQASETWTLGKGKKRNFKLLR